MSETLELQFDRSTLANLPLVRRACVPLPVLELPAELSPEVRDMARRAWEDRARSEYVGVMVVRRFHGLLVDLNAPMDLQELALLMMLQEQRHAALCMHAARALGSEGTLEFELGELQQPRTAAPPAEQLLEMICGTFLAGEVVALSLVRHAIRSLPRSPFRGVLEAIVRDEVLHGNIGEQLLCAVRTGCDPKWLEYPGDDWVVRCASRYIEAMRQRDVVEPDEAALFEAPHAAAQLRQLGIPDSLAFKAHYFHALASDVPKRFERAGVPLDARLRLRRATPASASHVRR